MFYSSITDNKFLCKEYIKYFTINKFAIYGKSVDKVTTHRMRVWLNIDFQSIKI